MDFPAKLRGMGRLLRVVCVLLIGLPLLLAALVFLALDNAPMVVSNVRFTPDNIERAKRLMERNDPRKMRPGVLRTVMVMQDDLDLALNYAASRYAHGSTDIVLQDGRAALRATFELPANPLGRYANVNMVLVQTAYLPRVEQLQIGSVPVPTLVCNWLLRAAVERLKVDADYSATVDVIKQVRASNGRLQVVFEWSDTASDQLKAALVPAEDQVRWKTYQARLVELTAQQPAALSFSLDELLRPMLQLARQRAGSASAAAEHRAVIVVLAFYINGEGLGVLVPAARAWPAPEQRVVTLAGRTDSPQHFLVSAALAATAGSPLSDAVGVYKELDDSRNSSGFSFNDLGADRAGSRFGEMAAASDAGAAHLSRQLDRSLREPDFFPVIADLPEYMTEAEFRRRYAGVGQPAYQMMLAEIERRIDALPLYR